MRTQPAFPVAPAVEATAKASSKHGAQGHGHGGGDERHSSTKDGTDCIEARKRSREHQMPTAAAQMDALQPLKQSIEPIVAGPELVPLNDGYVPRGPETAGVDGGDSQRMSIGDKHDGQVMGLEEVEAPINRYAGVIYAARFFVTRVGFLRSVKRIMVLSTHHLTIVDPYTEDVKERYAYDNIKEITVASDSGGGSNVDRSFTIFIGKNIKETYTCRNRQHLLSAYYQLRERASSFKQDSMDVATSATPGQGQSGMYFDNLFQLCGKTFTMTKLSTTRSTVLNPVKIKVLLAVRAASLDRLDTEKRVTLSSILLIDIVKVQRVTTNSNELLLYYEGNRVHRYWCDSREPFIQAIANNMRSWLGMQLVVEEVSELCEFDAITSTRDIPQPVSFEIPVLKISKSHKNKLQLRLLALTASAVVERDPVTRRTLSYHPLTDIYNVVMYPSMSSSVDEEQKETEGTCGKFSLELKHGRTRRYVCLNCTVSERNKEVGLGLQHVTATHEHDLRQVLSDIGGEGSIPDWLKVAGSTTILNPKEARSLFLCNMIEMCRMNKLHVSWSTEETQIACKEGTWGTEIHPEWEDILLRKLVNLNLIPNLVTKDILDQIFRQMEQYNRNIPLGGLRQRDRRAFTCMMKLLESFKEYSVAQLTSPSSSDAPIPTTEFQVAMLLTIQRLLCTRGVFEEVPHSQYKNSIEIIMELVHSPMEEVSFAAASVVKYMVINYSDTRSIKSETTNRRALFTKYHCNLFVSRAFDIAKTNRVGRQAMSSPSRQRTSAITHGSLTSVDRSIASALSYSQLGLDYLVLSLILQTLEVCLSSGKKATPERVARELLRAMRVEDFMRHHALFLFNRSLSFAVAKCSSILVKVHVLEQPSELVELIQDFARKHGALLWQLYLSLYAQDKAQRRISSQLVALLTHENARSSAVIRNIFPHALLDDLSISHLEYDEFGRFIPTPGPDHKSSGNSPQKKQRAAGVDGEDITNATETGRSKVSYGINTRAKLVKNSKCVVLLPEFFDRLKESAATKDLMWGPNAVEELIHKLEGEIASLDVYRLKYQCFLYTDPLASDQVVNPFDDGLEKLQQPEHLAVNTPFPPFEFLSNASETPTEQEAGAQGAHERPKKKKKKKGRNVPRWFVTWNANEFRVDYDCHKDEVKVGAYYLTNILNDRGVLVEDIECPDKFMTLLYYRLLAEEDSSNADEGRQSSSSLVEIDKSDIRLLVLKVMIQVYERHYTQLSSLMFLNHLLRVSMMNEDHKWPLVVRGNIVLFLDRVLSSAVNSFLSISYAPSCGDGGDAEHATDEPSRFTVVAEHCGAMSSSMIMQTCLSVLSRLIDCHTAEEEGSMHHDTRFPKHGRLTHFEGSAASPVSAIKRRLCQDDTIRFLVGLLDCPNRIVFKKCLGLIRLLVRHNEAVIPTLHATGLFYYLLRFAQDVEEMTVAARLISHIHLRQSRFKNTAGGKNKKGIFSPDPLTQICLRSWLVRLLPVSMVAQLLRHGPKRFAQALFADSNNPEVVWNAKMRHQMVSYIEKFMARHTDSNGVFSISPEHDHDHEACIALIQYPREVHALQCYQYYLHNLLDEKHFPGWPINDEAAFLCALTDSVNRWVHPEGLVASKGSEGVSAKLLSVKDAVQLLDATALLLRRFPESACITNLKNFQCVLEALEKCIMELRDGNTSKTGNMHEVSAAVTKKSSYVRAFASAIRVINLAVSLSDENAMECSSGLGLRVLCGALQLLFHNQSVLRGVKDMDAKMTTHWALEALVSVLSQPNGRVSAAAQSLDLLPCLTRFLLNQDDPVATHLSLQIVYEMAGSTGEMAEVLLLQLAEHGVLWYLALLLFSYEPNSSSKETSADGYNNEQRISIEAARAVDRILAASATEESIAVYVKRMQETIENIFTRPLIDVLRNNGPIQFLQILVGEMREPHVMWTELMRKELESIAQRAVQFHMNLDESGQEVHKVFELPSHFMYAAQKEELCVAGIYVNFFNENPQNGIQSQITGTRNPDLPAMTPKKPSRRGTPAPTVPVTVSSHVMHSLLTALAHDIAGVRSQPQVLEAVLMQRMLPVATAIRNLIQFTPDMDIQVVQSDGVLTLLSVLDHEAQPQAFSFACAPLLQSRCIECLHMLSFSGKCVDSLATLVPQFVKSAFQIVYHNLSKSDASTEGQLARITLQLLGNVCLIPSCIDSLVKGMDPTELANLLPQIWLGEPHEVQLLLCLHMIPLKRHTAAATQFAKAAVSSQLASSLLNLLSTLVPKSKLGDGSQTKAYAARFLSVLSSNPGSGGAISSLLIASRAWETHGDTTQGSSDDLRRLLVPPHAPALLKSEHANPQKIG
ncbi:TPA: hypothetical protein N0F65_010266 [Lagenidium giganteum]|uniref:DnaJ homologue subfamily C GRV2/DNAJC13 N-terminal domain-containing protein n=1 Tax=Lagenidium giganteum TaxID=4803 RepID=A0AAV2YRB7_9STRA|nr:TPA: hypothetical protein N0F65_010266 [Lagenidium giganteum]